MNNKELKIEELMNKIVDEGQANEEEKVLRCPICNERLMYMEPDGLTLYCKKCKKFFKNDNESVGKETDYPYQDENALY